MTANNNEHYGIASTPSLDNSAAKLHALYEMLWCKGLLDSFDEVHEDTTRMTAAALHRTHDSLVNVNEFTSRAKMNCVPNMTSVSIISSSWKQAHQRIAFISAWLGSPLSSVKLRDGGSILAATGASFEQNTWLKEVESLLPDSIPIYEGMVVEQFNRRRMA